MTHEWSSLSTPVAVDTARRNVRVLSTLALYLWRLYAILSGRVSNIKVYMRNARQR